MLIDNAHSMLCLDEARVIEAIDPAKDIDGLHPINAGSLYLVERGKDAETHADDKLWFKLPQNDSVPVGSFEESEVALSEASIAGYAALSGQIVNVADAYHLPVGSPFKVSRSFD